MPLEQIPILEFNGIRAVQSVAIARYVAKEVGLAGVNSFEDLLIDGVVDTFVEFRGSKLRKLLQIKFLSQQIVT